MRSSRGRKLTLLRRREFSYSELTFLKTETMQLDLLTPAVGAEISGVDLSRPIDSDTQNYLHQAFLAHHVLFFRKQQLQPQHLVTFASLFGPVGTYPYAKPLTDHPHVIAIIKEPEQRTVFGGIWHTDSAYLEQPSLGSVLYSREVPEIGGDTLFANTALALEHLAPEIKSGLENRRAIHSSAKNQQKLRADHLKSGSMEAKTPEILEASHPVIRSHPETGRQSLYLSPAHTTRFEDSTISKSDPLLQRLFDHMLKDDFKCRFRWSPNTLAIWDNRCLLHYPVNDYDGHRREMLRVTIDGDRPR